MTVEALSICYRGYIACLNLRDWVNLEKFVATDVHYNGQEIGMSGYRDMLEGNYRSIPDLHFTGDLLACESPYVSSRLMFDCTPVAAFSGWP